MDIDIEEQYNNVAGQIICKFETKLPTRFVVDSSKITISTDLDQPALENLIKNFLEGNVSEENIAKLHFEFLIGGELLRGKIKSHLLRHNISSEQVIVIEYFLALGTPSPQEQTQEEDWISHIAQVHSLHDSHFAVSLFNGSVSIYNHHSLVGRAPVAQDPLRALRTLPATNENEHFVISGGMSERINIHKINLNKGVDFEMVHLAECDGSKSAINSIDTCPLLDGLFCSAAGKEVTIWRIPTDIETRQPSIKKKSKKIHLSVNKIVAEASQQIHQGQILSAIWSNNAEICTGSMDHTIRLTDVEKLQNKALFQTADSITSSVDVHNETILSAHEDGYVRMWDKRTTSKYVKKFKSHTKFASSVRFSSSPFIFCSGSYDHTVKIWDTRSIFPLETLTTHHDKVFTVLWKQKKQILSGGSDSLIDIHKIESS